MENILISACLLGVACRYDGKEGRELDISQLRERYNFIPVCPEIYGGLPTPRTPSERVGERVLVRDGRDVTENYMRGAREAYRLCEKFNCKMAILKARSPSCGKGEIYDGSFEGRLIAGNGVTAEYLISRGIRVLCEDEIYLL